MLTATIIVIGDEILGGFTRDANSTWLAGRLRHHGVDLRHVATVPDEFDAIDEALSAALRRSRPHLVLTTGGIGSTPDDITYEAVAASLGRDVELAPGLARKIDSAVSWTVSHGLDVDDEFVEQMMRMARIPAGSQLLRRSGSWAPGVQVDVDGGVDDPDGATIVILPGVPSQLRSIVEEVLEPDILEGRGEPLDVVEVTHGYPESVLNRCLVRLVDRYPDVRVGSYPGEEMVVRLRGRPDRVRAARDEVERYLEELEADPAGARVRRAWAERIGRSDEVDA
jgi:molybdenum cofactor synthesis domain-containing protein